MNTSGHKDILMLRPLYPQKRKSRLGLSMSALWHKRTSIGQLSKFELSPYRIETMQKHKLSDTTQLEIDPDGPPLVHYLNNRQAGAFG